MKFLEVIPSAAGSSRDSAGPSQGTLISYKIWFLNTLKGEGNNGAASKSESKGVVKAGNFKTLRQHCEKKSNLYLLWYFRNLINNF